MVFLASSGSQGLRIRVSHLGCARVLDGGFTDMCSGSEAGSYLRLIDFVYHSTLSLRVIEKKKKLPFSHHEQSF